MCSCRGPQVGSLETGRFGRSDELAAAGLRDGLLDPRRADLCCDAVRDGSSGRGHGDMADPLDVGVRKRREVDRDVPRLRKAGVAPGDGHRQMHAGGQGVGEAVQEERSDVADHRLLAGPEPERDELVVLRRRGAGEAVHTAKLAAHPASVGAVAQELRRDVMGTRVGGGEEACASASGLHESHPVGRVVVGGRMHGSQFIKYGFINCKVGDEGVAPGNAAGSGSEPPFRAA